MFDGTDCKMRTAANRPEAARHQPDDRTLDPAGLEISEIAHDFKNLLAGIQMLAEFGLAQLPHGSPGRTVIGQIRSACGQAGDMCDALASAARRAGARQPREVLDLAALVGGAGPLLAASVSRATTLKFELSAGPAMIQADPVQIRQLLTNLVLNASQALGDRPGLVVVSTGTPNPDREPCGTVVRDDPMTGPSVFLEVSDTGCGMDEATRDSLFEPFFSTKLSGQGLGMASVLRIVTAHGGAIQVRSEPGAGTIVRVLFPRAGPPQSRSLPPKANGRIDATGPVGTVLVVDDDRGVRMLVKVLLESRGWTVHTVANGAEAVEALRKHRGDVSTVLLDMSLPGMDGAETLRQLREVVPGVPSVLLTGSCPNELAGRFAGETPDAFLSKPFSVDDLVRVIQAVRRQEG